MNFKISYLNHRLSFGAMQKEEKTGAVTGSERGEGNLVKRKAEHPLELGARVTKVKPYHAPAGRNEIYLDASRPIYAYLKRIKTLFLDGYTLPPRFTPTASPSSSSAAWAARCKKPSDWRSW